MFCDSGENSKRNKVESDCVTYYVGQVVPTTETQHAEFFSRFLHKEFKDVSTLVEQHAQGWIFTGAATEPVCREPDYWPASTCRCAVTALTTVLSDLGKPRFY